VKCPYCNNVEDRVVDSRPSDDGGTIRRRRECAKCLKRFTTYEKVEVLPLVVIKKDNSREFFNRDKLMLGITKACQKRPVSSDAVHKIVDEIETQLSNSLEREVSSQIIGELLMNKLKQIDQVAYVRFASVYRAFSDIDSFFDEIHKIRIETDAEHRDKDGEKAADFAYSRRDRDNAAIPELFENPHARSGHRTPKGASSGQRLPRRRKQRRS